MSKNSISWIASRETQLIDTLTSISTAFEQIPLYAFPLEKKQRATGSALFFFYKFTIYVLFVYLNKQKNILSSPLRQSGIKIPELTTTLPPPQPSTLPHLMSSLKLIILLLLRDVMFPFVNLH
jgi:hypothetical protein